MSLRELTLRSEYRSDSADLVADFYTPCLRHATRYWRAVGYFTSGGLALNAEGLATFIRHGGQMRLVTGPCLAADDIEAIQRGYEARNAQVLADSSENEFQRAAQNRLALLTWLIAHGHLDIKIACTADASEINPRAIYHEKIGIFLDDTGDAVAFAGSLNETVGGLLSNFESIDVYLSSEDTQQRVQQKVDNFRRLWDNATDRLEVVDFPTALAEELLSPQLVYDTTPSPDPPVVVEPEEAYLPRSLVLRTYQQEAIDAWFANGCCGLWEMATGTGKTITALSALAKLKEEKAPLFVLIACPYQHLVDQWCGVAKHGRRKEERGRKREEGRRKEERGGEEEGRERMGGGRERRRGGGRKREEGRRKEERGRKRVEGEEGRERGREGEGEEKRRRELSSCRIASQYAPSAGVSPTLQLSSACCLSSEKQWCHSWLLTLSPAAKSSSSALSLSLHTPHTHTRTPTPHPVLPLASLIYLGVRLQV